MQVDGRFMTNRITLINDLESFLTECFNTINDLVLNQRIKQTDARVTFFKHLVNIVDSTILSLILSHKYLGDENWWIQAHKDYDLSKRPIPFVREFDYYDQIVTNSYFFFVFCSFESSLRLIVEQYDIQLYKSQKDFNPLSKKFLKDLSLKNEETDNFIDVLSSVRNSLHNNGRYVNRTRHIPWSNIDFHFVENRLISTDEFWSWLMPISREIYRILFGIVSSDKIKKIAYFDDPTEST